MTTPDRSAAQQDAVIAQQARLIADLRGRVGTLEHRTAALSCRLLDEQFHVSCVTRDNARLEQELALWRAWFYDQLDPPMPGLNDKGDAR